MSQEIKSNITAKIENGSLIIDVPIDLLIWAQEHRESPIYITNQKEMEEYLKEYILDWGGDSEIGSTAFEDFLDKFFMDTLENGELFLEGWWEREENRDEL